MVMIMTKHYNKYSEKEKRKLLRHNAPPSERILWRRLKGKRFAGYKFRRQYSIDQFVLDFYCTSLKLAIELDGSSHFSEHAVVYDESRQKYI